MDSTLKVWDLDSLKEIRTIHGHNGPIETVTVTSDGRKAISGSRDNTLKVWDLENGREIKTLRGHHDCVGKVAAMPDGKRAISSSWDNTVKVWDIDKGKCIITFSGEGLIDSCTVSLDGLTIIVGEVSGLVHFLRIIQ
jgi:WD40 repeat protein